MRTGRSFVWHLNHHHYFFLPPHSLFACIGCGGVELCETVAGVCQNHHHLNTIEKREYTCIHHTYVRAYTHTCIHMSASALQRPIGSWEPQPLVHAKVHYKCVCVCVCVCLYVGNVRTGARALFSEPLSHEHTSSRYRFYNPR